MYKISHPTVSRRRSNEHLAHTLSPGQRVREKGCFPPPQDFLIETLRHPPCATHGDHPLLCSIMHYKTK